MNKSNIRLEILSPIHIGTQQEKTWHKNMDFFYQKGKVYVVDQDKLFAKLYALDGQNAIQTFNAKLAANRLDDLKGYIYQHVSLADIAQVVFDYPQEPGNEIKPLVRTGLGTPLIPGSSLKGAIRTAILTHLIKQKPHFAKQEHNLKNKWGRYNDRNLVKNYLGNDPNHDLLRMLHAADIALSNPQTILYKTQTLNLYGNSWKIKQSVTNYLECASLQMCEGRLHIPQTQLKLSVQHRILKNTQVLTPGKLFEIINAHSLHLLQEEIEFWEEELELTNTHHMVDDYLESLRELYTTAQECSPAQSCVLRVGAGTGWDSMTGRWAKDENILDDDTWSNLKQALRPKRYFDTPFPKSRKALEKAKPLGFVKLSWR